MQQFYHWFFPASWILFWAYWIILARWVKKNKVIEPCGVRLAYASIIWLAFVMPFFHDSTSLSFLNYGLWPRNQLTFFGGAAIMLAGLGFAIWARIYIGQNWSGYVALKENHQLIRSGPYKLVRHPIYTGILTGMAGTAIALAEVNGIVAFAVLFIVFVWKSRREEALMVQTFGDEYIQYRKEVPALVPGLKF